jgi:hypothetical protein
MMWRGGDATPASERGRHKARVRKQAAPASSSPPSTAPERLLVGGATTACHLEHDSSLPINDFLRDNTLLRVDNNDPWYADIVNVMASGYVPPRGDKRKLIYESRLHMWDEPYLFRICADGLLRRCVPSWEVNDILERCHSSEYGGHYGAFRTNAKVWQCGFFWHTMYRMPRIF